MVSDKRGGSQGGPGAVRGPRLFGTRPGSINRGFESVDPERQREPVTEGGDPAREQARTQEPGARAAGGQRAPASAGAAQPRRARRGRGDPETGGEAGSA